MAGATGPRGGQSHVNMTESLEISVEQVKRRLDSGEGLRLLDVRHRFEWRAVCIDGATLIPLDQLPDRLAELDRDRPIVVYCHPGVRSLSAARPGRRADDWIGARPMIR